MLDMDEIDKKIYLTHLQVFEEIKNKYKKDRNRNLIFLLKTVLFIIIIFLMIMRKPVEDSGTLVTIGSPEDDSSVKVPPQLQIIYIGRDSPIFKYYHIK